MAFSLNTNNLPSIRSYNEAVTLWSNAEISKKDDGRRYLWSKYDSSKLINYNETTGDVFMTYYLTDVVIWHKDNSVTINTGGYINPSTHTFINCLSGYGVSTYKGNQVIWIGHNMPVCFSQIITLKGNTVISGGVPHTKTTADRKRANEVLKPWKPVLALTKALYAMDRNCFMELPHRHVSREVYKEAPSLDDLHKTIYDIANRLDTYATFAERLKWNVLSVENGALVETTIPVGEPW